MTGLLLRDARVAAVRPRRTPAGSIPPNPSELLSSQQLADLLTELGTRQDVVILDAPPLLPVTDAAILATAADGAILITRYGATS